MVRLEQVLETLHTLGVIRSTKKVAPIKPGHGPCCTCQECGQHHDDCVCTTNEIIDALKKLEVGDVQLDDIYKE